MILMYTVIVYRTFDIDRSSICTMVAWISSGHNSSPPYSWRGGGHMKYMMLYKYTEICLTVITLGHTNSWL